MRRTALMFPATLPRLVVRTVKYLEHSNGLLLQLSGQALPVEGCGHVGQKADVLLRAEGLPDAQLAQEVMERRQVSGDTVQPRAQIYRPPAE